MGKRLFDIVFSLIGLLLFAPFFLVIAFLIKKDSPGPVFFRQVRVGLNGKTFLIHKFRTMESGADRKGIALTVGNDVRITRVGRWLRKYKIDELPQLIDVLLGKMSFVGPRPEVPHYVEKYPPDMRDCVLSVRPGITDPASMAFREESLILGDAADPERIYLEKILPKKLKYSCQYIRNRSLITDIRVILQTLLSVFRKSPAMQKENVSGT